MIWFGLALFAVSLIVTHFLVPRVPGHVTWWEELNWGALFDLRVWRTFFGMRDVQIALAIAMGVATW